MVRLPKPLSLSILALLLVLLSCHKDNPVSTDVGGGSSPGGQTWTQSTSGTINNLYCLTYYNGMFIAGGDWSTIVTSPDGNTWTTRNTGSWAFHSWASAKGLIVGVGDHGAIATAPAP